ncbi:MAG: flagellar filament capping protein FliD [Aquabacterium sp.]|nr:flagellar filament capping protein FliD [Aquabacterium sp.]
MAVTSTTATGASVLNVASIVGALMTTEQKPLTKLDARISTTNVQISMLGNFKSKATALQSAITALASSTSFSSRSVSSTSSGLVSATATSSAAAGDVDVVVTQSAAAQQTLLRPASTVASATAALTDGTLTVAGTSFTTTSDSTLTTLAASINGTAGLGVSASVVQVDNSSWALLLTGASTGASNTFTGSGGGAFTWPASNAQTARDAMITANGVSYTRSTNTFSDVLPGLSLTINQAVTTSSSANTARLTVASGSGNASAAVQTMVTAYNDLVTNYQMLTRSSTDKASRGPLNSDASLHNFMARVRSYFQVGVFDAASHGNTTTWSASGVTVQTDGTLAVDSTALTTALSGTLGTILSNGMYLGAASSTDNLRTFIADAVASDGLVGSDQAGRQTELTSMKSQRSTLVDRLAATEARYKRTYSLLDARLTAMQQTSTSLASALDALSASTNGK